VHLHGRQTVQRFGHRLVRYPFSLCQRLTFNHLRNHTAGGNSRSAAECLEFDILDDVTLDLQEDLHDVAAGSVADLTHTIRILDLTNIPGIFKVFHYFFAVHAHYCSSFN